MRQFNLSRWVKLGLAALLLNLLLISPNHPQAVTWQALSMLAIELPLLLLMLVLLPPRGRVNRVTCITLVVVIMSAFVFKGADFLMRLAFERHFNLITDWGLAWAGWATLAGTIGTTMAVLGSLALVALLAALTWLLWKSLQLWVSIDLSRRVAAGGYAAMLMLGTVAVADYGHMTHRWQLENKLPVDTFATRNTVRYATDSLNTFTALQAFKREAATQTADAGPGTLAKLKGHNVLILFVESYGRASLDSPLYAATQLGTLRHAQAQLDSQGLAMRSGWLDAPTLGGQSWLSHSTLATGLWINNQGRYRAMLASPRNTLFHDARTAGFETVAIMPAMRMTWPDGAYFGFDRIYQSSDLGYEGDPFNWVLVPDQFALAALDRLERHQAQDNPERHLFVQVALSSSHAPFTPVPKLLPWDDLGNGTVFNDMAASGDTPEQVWSDANRVREQYRQAVNYSLRTVFDYVGRHASKPDLVIVIGDHEPAPFISGHASTHVPIHVIGPPTLLQNIDTWDWSTGLVPDEAIKPWRMDRFRERFVDAFSLQIDKPQAVTQ